MVSSSARNTELNWSNMVFFILAFKVINFIVNSAFFLLTIQRWIVQDFPSTVLVAL